MPLELKINNVVKTVDVPPDTPLLWVLRDKLDLKGTKYGCGIGLCAAPARCIVGGQAVRSCLTPVGSVAGKPITTIEGLSPDWLFTRCRWPGRPSTCRNAATARPARSCLPPPCWRARRIPPMRRSTPP